MKTYVENEKENIEIMRNQITSISAYRLKFGISDAETNEACEPYRELIYDMENMDMPYARKADEGRINTEAQQSKQKETI